MEVIKCGLKHVVGGGCPCICSSGWSTADSMALTGGGCGYNCKCRELPNGESTFNDTADANSNMAYVIRYPDEPIPL